MNKFRRWFKKYFIPHEHNDHKPHFLRHESMMIVFLLVIVVELGFLAQVFIVFDKTKFLAAVLPGVLTQLTNEDRENYDAPPLIVNDLLTRAAELKAQDMAEKGYFAHTSPEGKTPWYWLGQVGYKYASAGENLAVNFYDSDDVDRAWMNSPTHKANIIKKEYTEIGIGVARGMYNGESTIFVAQFFGKPLNVAAQTLPQTSVAPEPVTTPVKTPTPEPTPIPKSTPIKTTPKPAPIKVTPTPKPIESTPSETILTNAQNPTLESPTTVLGEETAINSTTDKNFIESIKSFLQKALTSPSHSVALIYGGLALLIIMALSIVLFIRSELRHPIVMARGLAMIAVIVLLLYVNIQVLSIETIVPGDNENFSSFIAS